MAEINFTQAKFIKSCALINQMTPDVGFEFAFCGRSNVGKSSTLNALTRKKSLAKVSQTPGKTRTINIFELQENLRLCDLPGYGYAKVSHSLQDEWLKTLNDYFMFRQSLFAFVIVMDARHPLSPLDQKMLDLAKASGRRILVLLNKADKLKKSGLAHIFKQIESKIQKACPKAKTMLISAQKGTGIKEVSQVLNQWYQEERKKK